MYEHKNLNETGNKICIIAETPFAVARYEKILKKNNITGIVVVNVCARAYETNEENGFGYNGKFYRVCGDEASNHDVSKLISRYPDCAFYNGMTKDVEGEAMFAYIVAHANITTQKIKTIPVDISDETAENVLVQLFKC